MYILSFFPGEVLLGILGGDVPPGSPNPDPILGQQMSFFAPVLELASNKLSHRYHHYLID